MACGIVGDAKAVARQLIQALREKFPRGRANPQWRGQIESLAAQRRARLAAEVELSADPMMPQRFYLELAKVMPKDCMVTIDAGVAAGLPTKPWEVGSPSATSSVKSSGARHGYETMKGISIVHSL